MLFTVVGILHKAMYLCVSLLKAYGFYKPHRHAVHLFSNQGTGGKP
jgi:hypothetical protein